MVFVPMIAFFIFFVVYLLVTLRALCLSRGERGRMASLALEEDETKQ